MTREEFDRLVREVEQGIGRNPTRLRKRVAWLAVLGYSGLLATVGAIAFLGLLLIIPGIFWPAQAAGLLIFGGLFLVGGLLMAGRAMWVRSPPPEGIRVSRAQAPGLYAILDSLGASLNSIPIHVLMITPDHNASVLQVPRLGFFGWYRNFLLLGLPLMESLSVDEMRAVLAHELAHLSRRHAQSSQWIYRLRRSWEPVFANISNTQSKGDILVRRLIVKWGKWFWPHFNAHAFVMARIQEYEADAASAQLAGAQNAASALARIAAHSRAFEKKFWRDLWTLAKTHPNPPSGTFCRLSLFLKELPVHEQKQYFDEALRSVTTNADTHPSLSDRLRALGSICNQTEAISLEAPKSNSAEIILGTALEKVRADVEQLWCKKCEANWRAQHAKSQALIDRLEQLDHTVQKTDSDILWDKAELAAQLQGQEAAAPLLREILSGDPNHAAANFQLGCWLLHSNDADGVQHIERALTQKEEWLPQAADALHAYFQRTGQPERIRELYARLDLAEKRAAEFRNEQSTISVSDSFIPHELSDSELSALRVLLAGDSEVLAAHLARKQLHPSARQQLFVLCLTIRRSWRFWNRSEREDALVNRIAKTVRLPGRVLVFTSSGSFQGVASKVRQMPSSAVFCRSSD